jgi:hypothetical protein
MNIMRALIANIEMLGLSATHMDDEALSPFCTAGTWRIPQSTPPPGLLPTPIQSSIPHHPWLDLIPSPRFRDKLLLAIDCFDDEELCHDMCGIGAAKSSSGVIVWKDPWNSSGWEVTEAFLSKWGWALSESWDLFLSTNYWRTKRGERPLTCLRWKEYLPKHDYILEVHAGSAESSAIN